MDFSVPVPEVFLREYSKNLQRCLARDSKDVAGSINYEHEALQAFIQTAQAPEISSAHRAAATNAICGVLERLKKHDAACLDHDQWMTIFYIFLDRSDNAKGKSMRQLLIALCGLLAKWDSTAKEVVLRKAATEAYHVLSRQGDRAKVKPALQGISIFLSKGVFDLQFLSDAIRENLDPSQPTERLTEAQELRELLRSIFHYVQFQDSAPAAGQLADIICQHIAVARRQNSLREGPLPPPLWVEPLIACLRASPEAITSFRINLFPGLFKSSVPDYLVFLEILGLQEALTPSPASRSASSEDDVISTLLYTALQTGKEIGVLIESHHDSSKEIEVVSGTIRIPVRAFSRLMQSGLDAVRLAGLSLVISSPSTTRPLSNESLISLQNNLAHLITETDAGTRGEVLTLIQRMIDRLRAAAFALSKLVAKGERTDEPEKRQEATEAAAQINEHEAFLTWFVAFLRNQLHPAASYQHHISSLKTLVVIVNSGLDSSVQLQSVSKHASVEGKWPFSLLIYTPGLLRLLYDLVLDPFDDVRALATALLKMQPTSPEDLTESMAGFLKRAEGLMSESGRADHSDGTSRAYALFYDKAGLGPAIEPPDSTQWWTTRHDIVNHLLLRLDRSLEVSKKDISLAVGRYPMHGLLASLRYIMDSPSFYDSFHRADIAEKDHFYLFWRNLYSRLVRIFLAVWEAVRGVLCNDAPEGHMPEDLEDDSQLNTKDVLSYAWRALKEASTLLRVVMSKWPVDATGHLRTDNAYLGELASLSFQQLSELRHRGAFSAVAQGFTACCARAQTLGFEPLLDQLYQDALLCIRDKGTTITRRSAGIPSLITGILSSDPHGPRLAQAIQDLQAIAQLDSSKNLSTGADLPQVHAMNSLKAIFTSTVLGPSSEPYIVSSLDLAGRCLTSEIWAIRNCGLMLFRALVDRLFGSTESQNLGVYGQNKGLRVAYDDYPNLLAIVIGLLSVDTNSLRTSDAAFESVFPALKIIQRLPPPSNHRAKIVELVLELCNSTHWHIRDMAARTYCGLVPASEAEDALTECLRCLGVWQNQLHGRLLCVYYVVKALLAERPNRYQDILSNTYIRIVHSYNRFYVENPCQFTSASYLSLLNCFGHAMIVRPEVNVPFLALPNLVDEHTRSEHLHRTELGSFTIQTKELSKHCVLRSILEFRQAPDPGTGRLDSVQGRLYMGFALEYSAPDATCAAITTLSKYAAYLPRGTINAVSEMLFTHALNRKDPILAATAQDALANLIERAAPQITLESPDTAILTLKRMVSSNRIPPPSLVEKAVVLWALLVVRTVPAPSCNTSLADEITCLLSILRPLLQDSQSFNVRLAAATALAHLDILWLMVPGSEDLKVADLEASLLVYQILNDDDEEVREIGSLTAKDLLSRSGHPQKDMVSLVASQRLAEHLSRSYPDSPYLATEAVKRLLGCALETKFIPSADERFSEATAENSDLFAVEKQNLFVDEIREADVWASVLRKLSAQAIPNELAKSLFSWTCEGLTLLVSWAKAHHDGALGWASKPEVFIFGMQVIHAADVLEHWQRNNNQLGILASVLKNLFEELACVGQTKALHPSWMEMIEEMLEFRFYR
ncbi:hypothetical protein EJ06DRAFT_529838 [Trichodelitschia bisporula]|uniref:Uncharacterized protein n=1 Tax=Trichodelitschia bisporula TaxID=703511 RepID=A0A6G1HY12_9PEZI|nr:hypothetical protein EJ06DRAFT_529838 [Trichodelitschia bisporula]